MKLRDICWLWGHPEGRYNDEWGNTRVSRMTPMEGCLYLGVRNTYMVPVGWDVNMRQYNKSFTTLNEVGWECCKAATDPTMVDPIIAEAADFPNVKRIVFDDFAVYNGRNPIEMENLWKVKDRLQNNEVRPMEMWMTVYSCDLGHTEREDDFHREALKPFDGATMWTWGEELVPKIPEKWEIFKSMTEGKQRHIGVYLYDFGDRRDSDPTLIKPQLDWARERILEGEANGIVLHTNTMADLDLESYVEAIEWMEEHGDEEI